MKIDRQQSTIYNKNEKEKKNITIGNKKPAVAYRSIIKIYQFKLFYSIDHQHLLDLFGFISFLYNFINNKNMKKEWNMKPLSVVVFQCLTKYIWSIKCVLT